MNMAGPLSHICALDLSRILAAPWAGPLPADLGANVGKVERPALLDDQHTEEVLGEPGTGARELDRLRRDGVI